MALRPLKPCSAPGCQALVRGARYCDKHEHLAAAWATSKRADRTGMTGRPWRRQRDQILSRDGYLCQCQECRDKGRLMVASEVDHIIPVSQGGSDDPENLCAIAAECHRKKTQKESRMARGIQAAEL